MGRTTWAIAALLVASSSSRAALAEGGDGADLKIYGDASFTAKNHADVHSSFSAASVDLFPTYSTDRASFLAEVLFEGDSANTFGVDVERVQVSYLFHELLRLKVGRMHTAFGYYNDAYHHGRLFEVATGRPYLAGFEDSGGLLEAHVVGLAADGKLTLGAIDLHYDLEVGNGRTSSQSEVAFYDAKKDAKVVNLRLRLLPSFLDGLIVGANVLYDHVPAAGPARDPSAPPGVAHELRELDVGAHVVYTGGSAHVIAEGAMVRHDEPDTGLTYVTFAGFVEAGYTIHDFTPYVRFERVSFDAKKDPFYQTGILRDAGFVNDGRAGLKWLATDNLALKLEGRTFQSRTLPTQQSITAQCAFGF